MKVLMITGDKNMLVPNTEAYNRAELQRAQVDELQIFFWGRGGTSVWKILAAALKGRFDIITAQDPFLRGHMAWHLARLTGARLNLQLHTDISAYGWAKQAYALFHLRRADSIRVVSEKLKKQLLVRGITVPIFVLPVFLEVERFRGLPSKTHAGKKILWIGRFEDEKNPQQAIEIFKEVRKVSAEASLVMLGAGSHEGRLRAFAGDLPVQFVGWQKPEAYLAEADVVLCTSLHESWGASIVEALAGGVPVVAPDVGVAKEAGANVVDRTELAKEVVRVLESGQRGVLRLHLLSKEEWAAAWRKTLQ